MEIAVVGTGYVGLVTGVALAYLGHDITCVDLDEIKIGQLQHQRIPICEPGLPELMRMTWAKIRFTTDYAEAIPTAEIVFIAVGTPALPDGSPDLCQVRAAARGIGEHLGDSFTVIVNKSTVPVGCGNWVESMVRESLQARSDGCAGVEFAVVSNPEFLSEGTALQDTFYPDRIVIGSDDARAAGVLYSLNKPLIEQNFSAPSFLPRPVGLAAVPLLTTDLASAELIKYAANAFLAVKVSFINEIGRLAERVGAQVLQTAKAIGLDARIGTRFLQAGVGWGGSCIGKDSAALLAIGQEYGLDMPIVRASRQVNYAQREHVVEKLLAELKILRGRTVGILGLAFKPQTDDLRDAPALDIANRLLSRGVRVQAHDPIALQRARTEYSGLGITYCDTVDQVAKDADALVLVTEWPEYSELPWERLACSMRTALVVDGRNALDEERLRRAGFRYIGIGR